MLGVLACCVAQERDSHSSLRQHAASLQADLTELQASSAVAAAQTAAEKVGGVRESGYSGAWKSVGGLRRAAQTAAELVGEGGLAEVGGRDGRTPVVPWRLC